MIIKNFIVFEGIDGAGTSTQLNILKNRRDTDSFLFTAEPTGSETGLFLRRMLKGDVSVKPITAAYLFAADRNEHVNGNLLVKDNRQLVTGIREACEKGHTVVSDRYLFSSLAYQSIDCGIEIPRLLNSTFPLPEKLFFFDIEPEVSLKRITGRGFTEIYEKEDFLKKTEAAYKAVISEFEKDTASEMRIIHIDACLPKEQISSLIWREINS